jgi:hypothetical protein
MKRILSLVLAGLLLQASTLFADVVQDWTSVQSGMAGPYQDSNGSKVDFSYDAGPKGGEKALKITYTLVNSGYCGVYTGGSWDLSKSASLKFMAKSSLPGDLQIAVKDAFNVQYITKVQISSKDWAEVTVDLSSFTKDPYYTPPDAIAGHPMDLSKTGNINFSPQVVGSGIVLIGPLSTAGTGKASSASSSSAKASSAPAASKDVQATGPGSQIFDFTAGDEDKAGGTFQDSQGSSFKYTVVDNPSKKGSKYLKIDYEQKQGGYCGMYHRTGTGWDGQNWTGGKALSMMVFCKESLVIGLAIKDKNNNQYTANAPATKGGNWEKVLVPLDSFKLDPYYTPPDAVKGAPEDLSAVKNLNFQAQTVGKFTLAIDNVTLVK